MNRFERRQEVSNGLSRGFYYIHITGTTYLWFLRSLHDIRDYKCKTGKVKGFWESQTVGNISFSPSRIIIWRFPFSIINSNPGWRTKEANRGSGLCGMQLQDTTGFVTLFQPSYSYSYSYIIHVTSYFMFFILWKYAFTNYK